MKRLVLIVVVVLSVMNVMAQDNFYFSQYFQTGAAFNPAIAGVDNFLDIKLNYRNQWNGFTDAPSTNYLGVNGYIQKETQQTYKQYSLRTSNPYYLDSIPKEEISFKDKLRHGIGGHVIYDTQGPFEQISGFLNYALHFPISNKVKLSIGLSASITNQRIDLEKIILRNPDEDDLYQSLIASGGKNTYMDLNPGIMLYSKRFYVSYAAFRAFRTAISSENALSAENSIDHNIMAGYQIPMTESVKLLPSVLFNYNDQYDNLWDASMKVLIKEKTWAGISYRSTGVLGFMAGVYINNLVNLSYSYDYVTSDLNNYTNGSHEIILGLMLFKKDTNAPYLW